MRLAEKVHVLYRSGTGGRCSLCTGQTLRLHSPGNSIFCVICSHGRPLESVSSNRKSDSDSRCV